MLFFNKLKKTEYLLRAACVALCGAIACAFIPACGKNAEEGKQTLTVVTDADTEPRLEYVVNAFNEQSENYEVKIESYANKGVKKYYLRSGVIEADLITFIDFSDAKAFADILQPLNILTATGKYQSSMINNMRFADDNIYSLPSPGFLYSLCYNDDSIEKVGGVPSTYKEATTLSQTNHNEGYAFCASSTTDEGLVNTLMAISTPAFVTTTKGVNFLKNYYDGEESLANGSCTDEWKTVLTSFKELYDNYYFSLDGNGASDFVSGNSYAFYYTHDGSLASEIAAAQAEGKETPNYSFYPFVSSQAGRTSIITNPYYYISVAEASYEDEAKKEGINEFLDYYTSSEGQYAATKLEDGTEIEGSISFISDYEYQDTQFTGRYAPLKSSFESGRVFFADYFTSVFEGVGSILREYIEVGMSTTDLLEALDTAVEANVTGEDETYDVADTFLFDEDAVTCGETAIGNLVADAARISEVSSKIYAAFVPSSCINANLYKGVVTASELSTIFTDVTLTRLRIKGSVLRKIVSDNVALIGAQTEGREFMLMSGVRVSGDSATLLGTTILDDTSYPVVLPQSLIDEYSITTDSTQKVSLVECIKDYLKTNSPTATVDDRYGTGILREAT